MREKLEPAFIGLKKRLGKLFNISGEGRGVRTIATPSHAFLVGIRSVISVLGGHPAQGDEKRLVYAFAETGRVTPMRGDSQLFPIRRPGHPTRVV